MRTVVGVVALRPLRPRTAGGPSHYRTKPARRNGSQREPFHRIQLVPSNEGFINCRHVNRRLLQLSVAAMLVLAVGGHWVLLQSVAWVQMTVSFSQAAPLEEALKMTFDGKHPCALCKAVKQGKSSERESGRNMPDKKIDLFCPGSNMGFLHPLEYPPVLTTAEHASIRAEAPPRPPPKLA